MFNCSPSPPSQEKSPSSISNHPSDLSSFICSCSKLEHNNHQCLTSSPLPEAQQPPIPPWQSSTTMLCIFN
ncbi:hypothetical protein M0R45_032902 [Rubus argutus]|uniref:Uncharacterized protein n=1 Tax=Rubus argutus TaxID=59490 RepID=A0AAW1WJI3_RUBAR